MKCSCGNPSKEECHALFHEILAKELQKSGIPEDLGSLTISHIISAKTPEEHDRLVREWAKDVCIAWTNYHDLARHWIEVKRAKT